MTEHRYPVATLDFSADGTCLASGSGMYAHVDGPNLDEFPQGQAIVSRVSDGSTLVRLADPDRPPFVIGVDRVRFSPDGARW